MICTMCAGHSLKLFTSCSEVAPAEELQSLDAHFSFLVKFPHGGCSKCYLSLISNIHVHVMYNVPVLLVLVIVQMLFTCTWGVQRYAIHLVKYNVIHMHACTQNSVANYPFAIPVWANTRWLISPTNFSATHATDMYKFSNRPCTIKKQQHLFP